MNDYLLYLTVIGAAFAGLSMFVWRLLSGIALIKRTNFEGKAYLLRAERGDDEPPVILQLPPRA